MSITQHIKNRKKSNPFSNLYQQFDPVDEIKSANGD